MSLLQVDILSNVSCSVILSLDCSLLSRCSVVISCVSNSAFFMLDLQRLFTTTGVSTSCSIWFCFLCVLSLSPSCSKITFLDLVFFATLCALVFFICL
ncbi:hypothetical protein FKM82_022054 [Ascaphus truei]